MWRWNKSGLRADETRNQILTRDNANQISFLIDNRGQTKPGRS